MDFTAYTSIPDIKVRSAYEGEYSDMISNAASPKTLSSFRTKKARDMQNPRNAHRKLIEEKCNQRRKEAQDKFSVALRQRGQEHKTAAHQFEAAADLLLSVFITSPYGKRTFTDSHLQG